MTGSHDDASSIIKYTRKDQQSQGFAEANSIPAALRERPHWVIWRGEWRNGKVTKIPCGAVWGTAVDVTHPDNWGTYYEVCKAHARFSSQWATDCPGSGIG